MTVPVTKDDENYKTVMMILSNHESLSFDRLRMTRVEINNNSGLSTHFQMKDEYDLSKMKSRPNPYAKMLKNKLPSG